MKPSPPRLHPRNRHQGRYDFPAIVQATQSPLAGALALVLGIALAFNGASLFTVAASCCAVVLIAEGFLL